MIFSSNPISLHNKFKILLINSVDDTTPSILDLHPICSVQQVHWHSGVQIKVEHTIESPSIQTTSRPHLTTEIAVVIIYKMMLTFIVISLAWTSFSIRFKRIFIK